MCSIETQSYNTVFEGGCHMWITFIEALLFFKQE